MMQFVIAMVGQSSFSFGLAEFDSESGRFQDDDDEGMRREACLLPDAPT